MPTAGETRVVIMAAPSPGAVDLVTRKLPELRPGEALVEICYAGICGTDLHIIGWNEWAARSHAPPFALGHELCGEIVDVNEAAPFRIGDRVTAETHLSCGHCAQCRAGRGHTCEDLTTFSRLDRGAFADYAIVPARLLRKLPEGIPDRIGAIMEPLGISVRCAREVGSEGRSILVSGCGPIGLMAIAAARHFGAETIVASDPVPERRTLASIMGADVIVDPADGDLKGACNGATIGAGVDVAIETSGAAQAITCALPAIARGGTLVMVGLPARPVPLDITGQIVLREVSLRGVYGRLIDSTWLETERALRAGLDVTRVITDTYALADYTTAIATAQSAGAGKVLFEMRDP